MQANAPAPGGAALYYYGTRRTRPALVAQTLHTLRHKAHTEVTIVDRGARGTIGVGFAEPSFKLSRQPGWEANSWGYHGDDGEPSHHRAHRPPLASAPCGVPLLLYLLRLSGKKYHASGHGEEYGPTFATGDVVGAGINFVHNEIFFTKNGKLLGTAFRNVRQRLVPTIGLHRRAP